MVYTGVLTKMRTEYLDTIQYYLMLENDVLNMNQLLGKTIAITHTGYQCLNCGSKEEIYRQGFCKKCFFETPKAGDWIMKPELSKAHLGIEDRDLAYEKEIQLKPHIVYLANSSNVKVGVTRKTQVPTRWIDQGAHEALEIVEVPNRYLAGIAEVALKAHVADKTNWRKMLKNEFGEEDLTEFRERLRQYLPNEVKDYMLDQHKITEINFPVQQYPEKPVSLNLKKQGSYSGKLVGIKGQYLIFEDNTVFNVRANEGFVVDINVA